MLNFYSFVNILECLCVIVFLKGRILVKLCRPFDHFSARFPSVVFTLIHDDFSVLGRLHGRLHLDLLRADYAAGFDLSVLTQLHACFDQHIVYRRARLGKDVAAQVGVDDSEGASEIIRVRVDLQVALVKQ